MYSIGGLPWLVWGFCLPTMTLAHATFAINTMNHMFGSRRFETVDESTQQRAHGVLRGRRGLAQQPPPLPARGAERLLLVGIRSDVVHDPAMAAVGLAWDVQAVPERIYEEARESATQGQVDPVDSVDPIEPADSVTQIPASAQ